MVNRRDLLGAALGAGATLALTPRWLRALQALEQPDGRLLLRAIPSSGELLPVIGLTLANHAACADPAALREVLETLVANGGRVFDAMHQSAPRAEDATVAIVDELGIQNRLFLSWRGTPPGPPQPGAAPVQAQLETLLARLAVPRIDLVMVNASSDPAQLDVLKRAKREGRVRYIGVQAVGTPGSGYPEAQAVMRSEPIDFVGVHYAIDRREAEQTILPLAQERKIGVMAYFPFGGAGGLSCTGGRGLFARVGTTPLPAWAAEFDARTWAQFFLKYVVSHPAVTVARVGTTKATHLIDDIGGGIGRLPDEATRTRMAAFIDALPPAAPPGPQAPRGAQAPGIALPAAVLERYVGEWTLASGTAVTFRRDGATLLVTVGSNPPVPLAARSATRLQDPRGPVFEFQLDAGGTVTGLVLEQGDPVQRIPLTRSR